MVRYRRLTGKLPIETFDEMMSFIRFFQTDQMGNKMEIFYFMGETNLAHLDRKVELRANVIQSFDCCYHRRGSICHIEVDI